MTGAVMMLTLCTAGLSAHRCAQWRFGVSQCVSAAGRPSPLPRDVGRTSATVAGLLPRLRLCYASRLWDVVMARAGQGNQFWHRQPGRAPLTRCPALPAFAWTGSVAVCLGGAPASGCPGGTMESGRPAGRPSGRSGLPTFGSGSGGLDVLVPCLDGLRPDPPGPGQPAGPASCMLGRRGRSIPADRSPQRRRRPLSSVGRASPW